MSSPPSPLGCLILAVSLGAGCGAGGQGTVPIRTALPPLLPPPAPSAPAVTPSRQTVHLSVGGQGPAVVAGDWKMAATVVTGTDDRYDTVNTRERARRLDDDREQARRRGEKPPNPLPRLLHRPVPPPPSSPGLQVAEAVQQQIEKRPGHIEDPLTGETVAIGPAQPAEERQTERPVPLSAEELRARARKAGDRRVRAPLLLLALVQEGGSVRTAARRSGLSESCAREVIRRYEELTRPGVQTVVSNPELFLAGGCAGGR